MLIDTRERDYQRAYNCLAELLGKYPRNYLLQLDMAGMALLMKHPDQIGSRGRHMPGYRGLSQGAPEPV